MAEPLPAISGKQLIRLLVKNGWEERPKPAKHGRALIKRTASGRVLVTVVPNKSESLPPGTLSDILGPRQTQIGRAGLRRIIKEHGLP